MTHQARIAILSAKAALATKRKSEVDELETQLVTLTNDYKKLKATIRKHNHEQEDCRTKRRDMLAACEMTNANLIRAMEALEDAVVDQQDLFSD